MTSNEKICEEEDPTEHKSGFGMDVPIAPKTPHEEIMFCIESTNDIVSKIYEILERKNDHCDNNPEAICSAPDIVRNWTCRKSGFCPISSGEGCRE